MMPRYDTPCCALHAAAVGAALLRCRVIATMLMMRGVMRRAFAPDAMMPLPLFYRHEMLPLPRLFFLMRCRHVCRYDYDAAAVRRCRLIRLA